MSIVLFRLKKAFNNLRYLGNFRPCTKMKYTALTTLILMVLVSSYESRRFMRKNPLKSLRNHHHLKSKNADLCAQFSYFPQKVQLDFDRNLSFTAFNIHFLNRLTIMDSIKLSTPNFNKDT